MTDRSASSPPRPDDVRRSLRALADGSAPPCEQTPEAPTPGPAFARPESTVDDAERAVRDAREAASFLSAGRLSDLDRVVAAAARRGDGDVAARGRAARESLKRLGAALSGETNTDPPTAADPGTDPRSREDHFHSGRGTVLGDTAQRPDR